MYMISTTNQPVHLQRTRPSYQEKETLLFIYREHARAISRKRHCCSSTENTPELSGERDTVAHLQRTRHDPMTIYYSKLCLRNTCRKLRFSLKIFRSQPILTEKMARSKRVNTFHANSDIIILCHDRLARLRSQHAEQTRQEAAGPGKVPRGDAFYIMPFMTAKSVPELSALFY